MASTQEIKRRIRAITNTGQITKAMEMVSATKMRRSQEVALLSRPFVIRVLRLLAELGRRTEYLPEIMKSRPVKKTVIVLVAADRGLAGSFNANAFREFDRFSADSSVDRESITCVAVGKKAEEFLVRKGIRPIQVFRDFGDYADVLEVKPINTFLMSGFLKGDWDRVVMISTHFRTTLRQEVMVREILPINSEKITQSINELVPEYGRYAGQGMNVAEMLKDHDTQRDFEYLVEPDPKTVLEALAPRLVEIALYHSFMEANASEHSARMVAMKNASENAAELKGDLTLEYNKFRQAGITREVSEIVSGVEALQG